MTFPSLEADDSEEASMSLSVLSLVPVKNGFSGTKKLHNELKIATSQNALLCVMCRGWCSHARIMERRISTVGGGSSCISLHYLFASMVYSLGLINLYSELSCGR